MGTAGQLGSTFFGIVAAGAAIATLYFVLKYASPMTAFYVIMAMIGFRYITK